MSVFAILFGTRKLMLTEQKRGVMLAVAFESLVKLTALLTLAFAVIWLVLDNPSTMWQQFQQHSVNAHQQTGFLTLEFWTKTSISNVCGIFVTAAISRDFRRKCASCPFTACSPMVCWLLSLGDIGGDSNRSGGHAIVPRTIPLRG